ncbi:hypothetical protein LINGRAHAP2_LOCUS25375 [Linum grandiflorum]
MDALSSSSASITIKDAAFKVRQQQEAVTASTASTTIEDATYKVRQQQQQAVAAPPQQLKEAHIRRNQVVSINCYKDLGVASSASDETIAQRFTTLKKVISPARNPCPIARRRSTTTVTAEATNSLLNFVFEVLSDENSTREFDSRRNLLPGTVDNNEEKKRLLPPPPLPSSQSKMAPSKSDNNKKRLLPPPPLLQS